MGQIYRKMLDINRKHCAFLGDWHPKAAHVAARSRRCKQLGATDGHATRSRCHRWEPRIHSVSGVSTQGTCPNILGFKKMTRPMAARYRPISEPNLTREFWFFHHLEIDHYHVLLGTNIFTIFTQKSWTWHEHTWTSSPIPGRPQDRQAALNSKLQEVLVSVVRQDGNLRLETYGDMDRPSVSHLWLESWYSDIVTYP